MGGLLSRPETSLTKICIVSTDSGDADLELEDEERMLGVGDVMVRDSEGERQEDECLVMGDKKSLTRPSR